MEEKTGDMRKLHNIKFVVFHEDEMGGTCLANERDQKCIDAKSVKLRLEHLKGRDGLM